MRGFRGSSLTTNHASGHSNGMCPGTWVVCKHCGYTWCYRGAAKRATCPNCGLKTPVGETLLERVNKFFEQLERARPDLYQELELLRILLLRLLKDGELKESLLEHALSLAKTQRVEERAGAGDW
ncbi:hypothetical protein Pyrde_0073 [Pyrodictium delaneyi]|uniref:Uncharacterized protein n=1 Tax=Pyrodictium delaneyi TaxID=1273541 RepID=A0A0P0MZW0_9CREN|nr:hypothetical protein Pyrde_0073 [Pyrodictium delaneyi]